MMRKTLVTMSISLMVAYSSPTNAQVKSNHFQAIVSAFEQQLTKDLKEDNIGGSMSVAIVRKDKILWAKALGYADKQRRLLADTSTIYRTGSISKSFTAFLLMELTQEGVIRLSDPIERYLPEVKQLPGYSPSTKITFLQLATHMSGLSREPQLEGAASGPIQNWENKVLASIPTTTFESRPGERFSYSNIGYAILGLSLSRAARKPFMQLVAEKIFIPLKMNNSYFIVPPEKVTKLATGLNGGPSEQIDTETPRLEQAGRGYKVPNGGIYSTPNDLAKFVIGNMGYGSLLKAENLAFMQTEQVTNEDKYGLGFFIYQDSLLTMLTHNGSIAGYTAQLSFEKESQYGVILMRNYNFGATDMSIRCYNLLKELKQWDKQQSAPPKK